MAPSVYSEDVIRLQHNAPIHVRDPGAAGSDQSSADAVDGAANTQAASTTMYIGIGAGVGGAILIAIIILTAQILRKRAQHRRAVKELEQQSVPATFSPGQEVREVPRPASIARCGTLNPLHSKAGWGALSSDETIHESDQMTKKGLWKRNSVSLPKRIRQRAIPLKRLKHLSAIIESPRSRVANPPSPTVHEVSTGTPTETTILGKRKTVLLHPPKEADEDVFVMPGSPKPHVLPSFAIRSPGMYGAAIANDARPSKTPRSISVGALQIPVPDGAVFGHTKRQGSRPQMHTRSISLGAPQNRPPPGPVPPVPSMVLLERQDSDDSRNRLGMCISRGVSCSSQESASSSVLVTTLIRERHEQAQPIGSPSVDDVVADDDSAQLKTVSNRQWQSPRTRHADHSNEINLIGNATGSSTRPGHQHHPSIRSNAARYSTSSHHRLSTTSTVSSFSETNITMSNRLSIPQIGTADRVSISRVSSYGSLRNAEGSHTSSITGAVQKIVTTPRKPNRTSSVSAAGSPAERRKTSVLREISGNSQAANGNLQLTPSRQASDSTVQTTWSGRSSNGNPFQWDQQLPLAKPSALKGSPTSKGSRKGNGHRRQNCVRISTLQPQILGPPARPSRPTSPVNIMLGIQEEEGADGEEARSEAGMSFVRHEKLPRQSSASSLATNLKVKPVRVSLTPSSPTLSMWTTAYQEQQQHQQYLPSQPSDSQLSVSASPVCTRTGRPQVASRQSSDRSSGGYSIPRFPSPSRATVGGVQWQQPIPEFYLSRPSTDGPEEEEVSSPFIRSRPLHKIDHDVEASTMFSSSPPLPISKEEAYVPDWPILAVPARNAVANGVEYDPASPLWAVGIDATATSNTSKHVDHDHSSPSFFPFALHNDVAAPPLQALHYHDDAEHISPRTRSGSRPTSTASLTSYGGDLPDTPPCSPKTRPAEFNEQYFTKQDSAQSPSYVVRSVRPGRLTAAEKLTSANASAIMATIPEVPPTVGFRSAVPILAPPSENEAANTTPMARRQRSCSTAHPAAARSPSDIPQPLHIKQPSQSLSPQGPRTEPAKSVLKHAMALRRMNSEIDQTRNLSENRASRRYVRLGREASPLLPWIGPPDFGDGASDSCNDLFDFDFGEMVLDVGAGAAKEDGSGSRGKSALDDIDMASLDRRLDGALAGFEPGAPSSSPPVLDSQRFSVWEDGELFWQKQPRFSFTASSSPLLGDMDVTPVKKSSAGVWEREQGAMTPVQRLRMPDPLAGGGVGFEDDGERPSSILKTPRSLYDSEGFLRS
ncbi:hypothetical protein B0A54_07730 [Friedmanniomyces endolithicus]|uniref:Uncharacterized protein n=1 Tax=Friedmanniomyces endolithicus TaxID=329885 RepID=A0A4U0UYA6_9PEZI|nr:hypothetical protein LTS09_001139 [Friedmanniomyces endolithicus]TKA41208.1 hypothetical protein B0A54_07730 [Friedmanniomyces endolithicus]